MEFLFYPHESCKNYVIQGSAGFGPVDDSLQVKYEQIPFQSVDRFMAEGKGPFHENYVRHFTADGEINYSPHQQKMEAFPSKFYPDQVRIPVPNSTSYVTLPLGYHEQGTSYAVHLPSGSYGGNMRHYLLTFTGTTIIVIYAVAGAKPTQFAGWYKTIYSAPQRKGNQVLHVREQGWNTQIQEVSINTYGRLSVTELQKLIPNIPITSTTTSYGSIGTIDDKGWLLPAELRAYTSQVCSTLSMGEEYLPEKHFGELANDACKKLNANDVNMLEFLRDLRRPTEMIPKLRNLRSLPGWASNYLSVHYGLLPTISDLSKIVKAATRAKRGTNRAGHTITSKRHLASKTVNGIDFTLEQHAKLCIEKVDSDFKNLINTVESVGFAPTLKNVWELVPYSFAIDWFVSVSDLLDRVDGIHRLLRYPIRYTTLSTKRTAKVTFTAAAGHPITGYISIRRYHRWTQVRAPLPPLFSLQDSADPLKHWLEASALVIQRAKK